MWSLKPSAALGSVLIGAVVAGLAGGLCGVALKSQLIAALSADNRPPLQEVAARAPSAVDAWAPSEGAPPPFAPQDAPPVQTADLDPDVQDLLAQAPPVDAGARTARNGRARSTQIYLPPPDDPPPQDFEDRGDAPGPHEPPLMPAEREALY